MTMVLDEKKQLKDITLQELDNILTSTTEAITEAEEREQRFFHAMIDTLPNWTKRFKKEYKYDG